MSDIENIRSLIEKYPIQPLNDAFIVSTRFFRQVEERNGENDNTKVNNKELIKQGQLKKDIKQGEDFEVVSFEVWDYISTNFGGGPEIKVAVLPDGTAEIVKLQLNIQYKTAKTQIIISRNMKVEYFMEKVINSFHIPRNQALVILPPNSTTPLEIKDTIGETLAGLRNVVVAIDTSGIPGTVAIQPTMSGQNQPPPLNSEKNSSKPKLGKRAKRALRAAKSKAVPEKPKEEAPVVENQFSSCELKPHGLHNMGNTCYMNSALQCILSLPKFIYNLPKIINESDKPVLSNSFADFVSGYLSGSPEPSKIKRAVGRVCPLFSSFGQQDSQEFYSFLVDGMHDECKKELKNKSIMDNLFFGYMESTTKCANCGEISTVVEPFTTLSLPIAKNRKIIYIPLDISKPMLRVCQVPTDVSILLVARSMSGMKVVDQLDDDAIDHLAFEIEETGKKRILTKMVDQDRKNICLPFVVSIDDDSTHDQILDQIWEVAQHMWLESKRESVRTSLTLDPRTPEFEDIEEFQRITIIVSEEQGILSNRVKICDPPSFTINDLLFSFTSSVVLDSSNQWKCEHCNSMSCARRYFKFKHLPDVLALQIKRFNGRGRKSTRDNTPIQIPLTLDLKDEHCGDGYQHYELRSISQHSGTLSFGHYTAIGKRGEKWYSFNDSSVIPTTPPDGTSASAYVVFYAKPFSPPKPVIPENIPEENQENEENKEQNDGNDNENEEKPDNNENEKSIEENKEQNDENDNENEE